ncbi:UDP-N-acetylglucosamine 2-epimerase [Lederbergia wuyishanensis]|uniref:UDP-N-acetylglucosamine 2-epimerase (Non-hydrolyzing)/GDP/UDP-N,N'-diacetylbacillosamine 2-epimerase (Hydrolyzing) n=1 Tax=Lederbergia wuyishanensis TaxID=1347903 RepID=A0ABU0D8T3_9BACI|nr:UDP-N-acetylglucosamine 2-epimerase [Lederbergia wuyishanensis]MCJ8007605.1 UDP-N-acetylglucosamine 2-epimerase [Lederbergia wuyishanensis]MDQ0344811.1 UDP-N-acetylglucosamine 2-epimerase (non-hydrolyzing)/GDP/UDP-N,N'-diacetylbacillosamine 2-epimerase (hydrolyzing) [Lederbergia wuyishanensis]
MKKKRICVVTGTRAEYGLLYWLMKEIQKDEELELQLVVTGMHLSPEFGLTYKEIEEDGFVINEKIEILLSSDSAVGVAKSMGLAVIEFAGVINKLSPDLVIILGDRFEMLAIAQTALVENIPIAHIHGGELTFGAYDDSIRHAITKMATWHFTSTEEYRNRVIQLGESPDRVWNVGALGIENILKLKLFSKGKLLSDLGIIENKPYFLITQHPETNGSNKGIDKLLLALAKFENYNLIFTKSNADNGGRYINDAIEQFVTNHQNAYLYDSLGQLRYLSAVKHAKVVIGNSSSGLIEVPYLETPTVNCGNRQAGRQKPSSVFDAELNETAIINAIHNALLFSGSYEKIFGVGNSSKKIIDIIKKVKSYRVQKEFYDL